MKFIETPLPGAFLIEPVRLEDERGFFARTFCQREFEEHGLNPRICQCNISYNRSEGALRGLHYQKPPDPEAKLVKCIRGAIYDVIVDLRPGSPSFAKWYAAELSGDNRTMLYVPEGFAHGFQTLVHTAPGAGLFPYIVEESLVGFLEQSSKFLKPVYAGDTIYPALEVIELVPGRTTGVVTLRSTVFNQRKELVLEGIQKFLLRRRPA